MCTCIAWIQPSLLHYLQPISFCIVVCSNAQVSILLPSFSLFLCSSLIKPLLVATSALPPSPALVSTPCFTLFIASLPFPWHCVAATLPFHPLLRSQGAFFGLLSAHKFSLTSPGSFCSFKTHFTYFISLSLCKVLWAAVPWKALYKEMIISCSNSVFSCDPTLTETEWKKKNTENPFNTQVSAWTNMLPV